MEAIRLMRFFSRNDHGGYDPEFLRKELLKAKLKIENKMGTFKIEITAVGGHGVDREVKDGEIVNFFKEGNQTPDAIAKFMELNLRNSGCMIDSATITHWPGQESQVVDDLITGKRSGNF